MQNESPARPASTPEITVLFPTYGRSDRAEALLERLAGQTLAPERFEVVVVDDGSRPPTHIDVAAYPFRCRVLHQTHAGPAAARNAGIAISSAPLVLMLNDDAVPAQDLLESHLAAHAELGGRGAVLGSFRFTENARRSPFTRLLDESDLLFAFTELEHGATYDWRFFWTCNVSVPTSALLEVGGFDEERFDRAVCEDVELGLRLQRAGVTVTYREDCVAHHDHSFTPAEYFERAVQLGRYQRRLGETVGRPGALFPPSFFFGAELASGITDVLEERREPFERALTHLEAIEAEYHGQPLPGELAEELLRLVATALQFPRFSGLYLESKGIDPREIMDGSASHGTRVSVVVVSCDALENTQRCIEHLRAARDERYPQEIIVVDNGSTDGSVEWLAEQDDVELVRNDANFGAPRARNQGIGRATGDWIAFLDNDVFVPVGWLDRGLYHGALDPSVGSVALCANRASKHQVVGYDGPSDASSIQRFADRHYAQNARRGVDSTLFTSLAVLVRAEALDRIGGFDETFSPWGFEDDDLALRIRLTCWRNRVALDTFVFHAPYDGPAKQSRHAAWLEQNWRAFLAKWSPATGPAALFDYSNVRLPEVGEATEAQIVFELPAANAPAPRWDTVPAPTPVVATAPARTAPIADLPGDRSDIVVLGCGRSGTSMVTGMLASAGWYVGDRPHPARDANPKGFFETPEINGINEFLLSGTVTGEAPLRRMQHWLAHAPEPLEFEVDRALRERMDRLGERGPFAYKDPRFCYTLGAWRPSLEGAKFVCVFREPGACAESILKECATADYLSGVEMDRERALRVWNAMYRRILDEHVHDGDWLFVHFDELLTPAGVERLESFVGAPVAADFPEARFKRSRSHGAVPDEIARTYDELCSRARFASAPIERVDADRPATRAAHPELTVLVCTYERLQTLERCLASFESQTAAGRYEIVVVNDGSTDGTREWLDEWRPSAPARVLHQENGGLAAARNAGLRVARGRIVLFVNDDTIAAPDLVEQHLAAHAEHGPGRAVLGTFEQPRAALDNALMRVLEETHLVFCYEGLDSGRLHDWTRFWTCNVSVPLEDVKAVGLFDESFRRYGCEDTDLGYRLETERGVRVVFQPGARARHEHVLTFEDLRRRSRTVAEAFVRFFKKHPGALTHAGWRGRAAHTLEGHEALLVETLPDRARAEAFARELSRIDVGALERTGPEGDAIAASILDQLRGYLTELNHLWWAEGECTAFREHGMAGMADALRRHADESTERREPLTVGQS
ncbi:MAG: glycosyltransferase [Planctomycetota bacterium]